ncbi:MAG: exodeoxyribonuclease VII small subunit [Bacteroidetes bacterium]|jgi:exodeoxyribonuclease VII small subunit|nr:exodeoxyribonuclease VII small subunit [Bacteroidota bacterium]MBK9319116.1 exodeoxyribonuclease VII small subunit [Bacteroidota bacterium]
MAEKFSYEKAKAELEEILEELERGETGVDTLAKHVKRASELIRLCREKLRSTESEVDNLLKDL